MMTDLRADLLNPAKLLATFEAGGLEGVLAVCRQFPDDPAVRLIESALTMSAVQLEDHPDALPMLLYARLHAHIDNPDIAALRQSLRPYLDFIPVQEPTHFQAGGPVLTRWKGHTKGVSGALVTPDNNVLSWSHDNTLRLWSLEGETLAILVGHEDFILGALVLPDKQILSWSMDRSMRFWSAEGKLLNVVDHPEIYFEDALALPDGRILTWWPSVQPYIYEWSPEGAFIKTWEGFEDGVEGVALMPDGRIISWGTSDPITFWSSDGNRLEQLNECAEELSVGIHGLIFSWLDGDISLWSAEGELLEKEEYSGFDAWSADARALYSERASWLPDGRILYKGESTFRIMSPDTPSILILKGHEVTVSESPGPQPNATLLPNGRIASWSRDNTLRLWEEDGTPILTLFKAGFWIENVYILPNNTLLTLYFGHYKPENHTDYTDLYSWSALEHDIQHPALFTDFEGFWALSDGRIASWANNGQVQVWSLDGQLQTSFANIETPFRHNSLVVGIFLLSNGDFLTLNINHENWSTAIIIQSLDGQSQTYLARVNSRLVLTLKDGRVLIDRGNRASIYVLSSEGKLLSTWETDFEDNLHEMSELSNGNILAWTLNNQISVWSSEGDVIFRLTVDHLAYTRVLALSDYRIVCFGNRPTEHPTYMVMIWSSSGELIARLSGIGHIRSCFELPNGQLLLWLIKTSDSLWLIDGQRQTKLVTPSEIVEVWILSDGQFISQLSTNQLCIYSSQGLLLHTTEMPLFSPLEFYTWAMRYQVTWVNLMKAFSQTLPYRLLANDTQFLHYSENQLILYDATSAHPIAKFVTDSPIKAIALIVNDSRVAIGCHNGQIIFLDLPSPT